MSSLYENGTELGGGYNYDSTANRPRYGNSTLQATLRLRNDLYCVEWNVKLYYTIQATCTGYLYWAAALQPKQINRSA